MRPLGRRACGAVTPDTARHDVDVINGCRRVECGGVTAYYGESGGARFQLDGCHVISSHQSSSHRRPALNVASPNFTTRSGVGLRALCLRTCAQSLTLTRRIESEGCSEGVNPFPWIAESSVSPHLALAVVRPPWSGKRQMVRKRDQTGPSHGQRRTKGARRSSQALCGPSGPILAEIYQPSAQHDPRAMVQGANAAFTNLPAEGGCMGNLIRTLLYVP